MVEARGSLEKLSAKVHDSKGQNKKKERVRSNNLLIQDINAIFHEKVKKQKFTIPMYIFFLILKNPINGRNRNKWAKLMMHLPKNTSLLIVRTRQNGWCPIGFFIDDQQMFQYFQVS